MIDRERMTARHAVRFASPVGVLEITEDGIGICSIRLVDPEPATHAAEAEPAEPLLAEAVRQLTEYFAGVRRTFDLPLHPQGTRFRQAVWKALTEIPYGQTRSYSQIAEAIGAPKSARAVGMANHENPILIVVPCHRVIGKNGSLTGYAGGLPVKQKLLELEGGQKE